MNRFSDEQIISLLDDHSMWAKRACKEILRRKKDFIPLLLAALDETLACPDAALDKGSEIFIPASYLLAHMREAQAYPRLAALINFDDDMVDELWGDVLAQDYAVLLRDTFNGDTSVLKPLIENRAASPWSRIMAVSAWGMLFYDGFITRQEIIAYFRHLISDADASKPNKDTKIFLTGITISIVEQHLEEMLEDVRALYKKKAVDDDVYGNYEEYAEDFFAPGRAADDRHIDDAVAELNGWNWFEIKQDDDEFDEDEDEI
jgi:hypothetical protein